MRSYRVDFRPESADFRPERVDLRPEGADLRPEGGGTETGKTDRPVWNHRLSAPPGPLPKKCENGHFYGILRQKMRPDDDGIN